MRIFKLCGHAILHLQEKKLTIKFFFSIVAIVKHVIVHSNNKAFKIFVHKLNSKSEFIRLTHNTCSETKNFDVADFFIPTFKFVLRALKTLFLK